MGSGSAPLPFLLRADAQIGRSRCTMLMRYPGSKRRLRDEIVRRSLAMRGDAVEYREPFAGGWSVGMRIADHFDFLWINDAAPGVAAVWKAVIRNPLPLIHKIVRFDPSVEAFEEYRAFLRKAPPPKDPEIPDYAFRQLGVQAMSFSGLGVRGGPYGGYAQTGRERIDGRWCPDKLCRRILALHRRLRTKTVNVTCTDFQAVIADRSRAALILADPPYIHGGNALYARQMTIEDHERLAQALLVCPHPWVLTIDDCPEARDLYSWARVETVPNKYTITTKNGTRDVEELLIFMPY